MKKYQLALARKNGTGERHYSRFVAGKIRKRYSIDAELAVLRQRDEKPEEFEAYNAYAEACKREARVALGMEEGV